MFFQGIHEYAYLGDTFMVFLLYIRVRRYSSAAPAMDAAIAAYQSADSDAGVHLAVSADIAETATVNRASCRFQLFDNFHGADLRGAGNAAAGETIPQDVYCMGCGWQLCSNCTDQVVDVGKTLQAEQPRDIDGGAVFAEIVAQQVHDHQIFRAVFRAVHQDGGIHLI